MQLPAAASTPRGFSAGRPVIPGSAFARPSSRDMVCRVCVSSSHEDTSHVEASPTLMTPSSPDRICKDPIRRYSHAHRCREGSDQHTAWGQNATRTGTRRPGASTPPASWLLRHPREARARALRTLTSPLPAGTGGALACTGLARGHMGPAPEVTPASEEVPREAETGLRLLRMRTRPAVSRCNEISSTNKNRLNSKAFTIWYSVKVFTLM